MSRLCLVVGLPDGSPNATPTVVYLGRSGSEMRDAIAKSTAPRHIEFAHLHGGIPKNNSRAHQNLTAALAAKEAAAKTAEDEKKELATRLDALVTENEKLKAELAAAKKR